jgi:hypothetical protein
MFKATSLAQFAAKARGKSSSRQELKNPTSSND